MRLTSRLGSAGLAIYFWAFVVFLFAPLAVLLIFSVNKSPTPTLPLSGFSTKWFHEAFGNGELTGLCSEASRSPSSLLCSPPGLASWHRSGCSCCEAAPRRWP